MLLITRKKGESFTINGECVVTVIRNSCHGAGVQIGISAPDSYKILRDDARVKQKKEVIHDRN